MNVFIASDHRGFEQKQRLLHAWPQVLTDLGSATYQPEDDYNDAAIQVAQAVIAHPGSFGILICGSAHGVAIQANRFHGIRAINGFTPDFAKIGRQHNDANILCLSSDSMTDQQIDQSIEVFLSTEFVPEQRYIRRNQRLDQGGK